MNQANQHAYNPHYPNNQQNSQNYQQGLVVNAAQNQQNYQASAPANHDLDEESELGDDGPPCFAHFFTVFGLWIVFGGAYWTGSFVWGYRFRNRNVELFYWTAGAYAVAMAAMVCVLVGISKGIELGTRRAAKWVLPYCLVVTVNIWAHVYFACKEDNVYLPYSIAFIACDFASMFYLTAVCYGFYFKYNKALRFLNFALEWLDLSSQIVVALVYAGLSTSEHMDRYENAFWVFILIQLFFWVIPILFGSGTKMTTCLRQIFLLDLCTDLPLLIINIASGAFMLSMWIMLDLVVKVFFMLRYVWVFLKYVEHSDLKSNPCKIITLCPFCCNID